MLSFHFRAVGNAPLQCSCKRTIDFFFSAFDQHWFAHFLSFTKKSGCAQYPFSIRCSTFEAVRSSVHIKRCCERQQRTRSSLSGCQSDTTKLRRLWRRRNEHFFPPFAGHTTQTSVPCWLKCASQRTVHRLPLAPAAQYLHFIAAPNCESTRSWGNSLKGALYACTGEGRQRTPGHRRRFTVDKNRRCWQTQLTCPFENNAAVATGTHCI